MAIISNTFTKYSVVGLRESLSDIIYNISPETTPFISNMTKRRQVTNTFFEWQVDSLASAQQNAAIDGDDLSSFTAVTATSRLGNYTQIARKDFIIADNLAGSLDLAGRNSEISYQLAKKGDELKRDMEVNFTGVNQAAVAGNNTTARKTASLSAFIRTNTSKGTGGADPTVSSGIVNAARTDGTQRAFTEAMLKAVVSDVWSAGGEPDMLLVGPFNKQAVSAFAGIAAQRYMAPSDGPSQVIGAADVYVSDFGAISVIPSRFSRERDAYVIDPDLVEMATLRPLQSEELAKTGDATKFMLLQESGLQVNNEAGLGIIADLTTS
ncbi:major head protein [uncultured Mediterranean phage uvMED]|nr:major head protein [uncultured Mediterranean phage uvMED]